MGLTNFPNGITSFGNAVHGSGGLEGYPGGNVYYIDSERGSDSGHGNGKSWDKAWASLAYGFDRVDNDMSGAERSTVFVRGSFTEDLTKLVSKSDIIGCGSKSNMPYPRLRGTHIIADEYNGTRLINFYNENLEAAYNWTFAGGGFEIHNCKFRATYTEAALSLGALSIAEPHDVKIYNNQFLPLLDLEYDTAAIAITSAGYNCQIFNNEIWGDIGIAITDSATYRNCRIKDNFIRAIGVCIDDDSSDWYVTGNECISDVAATTAATLVEVIDSNVARASNNRVTCGEAQNAPYPVVALGS